MLVLSRKPGQSILIGDNIEVQIIEIRGPDPDRNKCSEDISIVRKELIDEVKLTNREAVVDSSRISLEDLRKALKK